MKIVSGDGHHVALILISVKESRTKAKEVRIGNAVIFDDDRPIRRAEDLVQTRANAASDAEVGVRIEPMYGAGPIDIFRTGTSLFAQISIIRLVVARAIRDEKQIIWTEGADRFKRSTSQFRSVEEKECNRNHLRESNAVVDKIDFLKMLRVTS